jgi:hypothetical protein
LLEETLTPCDGLKAYQVAHSTTRTVGVEALVCYEKSDYSVPARGVGTRVTVTPATTSSSSAPRI